MKDPKEVFKEICEYRLSIIDFAIDHNRSFRIENNLNTLEDKTRYLYNVLEYGIIRDALNEREQLLEENKNLKDEYEKRFNKDIGAVTKENQELRKFVDLFCEYATGDINTGHEYIQFDLCRPLGKRSEDMDFIHHIVNKYGGNKNGI